MALSGLHVTCSSISVSDGIALMGYAAWSQTLASAGVTARGAAGDKSIMQVTASVDAFFAVGASPDATQTSGDGQAARYYVPAGVPREVFCKSGDKLAWVPA